MRCSVSPSHHFAGSITNTLGIASFTESWTGTTHDACGMWHACQPSSLLCWNSRRLRYSPSFLSTTSIDFLMFFLLFVYFLTQSNLGGDASPIPQMERRADVACDDLNNCRTIWNIVWSCLSTVLLCTWVTLHPNITIAPDTRNMRWFEAKLCHPLRGFLKNKLPLFLCALIAPEYILAWAIRQNLKAREIQRKWNFPQESTDKHPAQVWEWTRAHAFFLIMGGFHLYSLPDGDTSVLDQQELSIPSKFVLPLPGHLRKDAKAEHPLDFDHLSVRELAYLAPTEREIKDKGKANIIAKILVVLQTSWFIAQCVARGVKHLPLTELEVVTLAYATMNAFIYYFWWDKPKDVECSVRVYQASKAGVVESGEKDEWESGAWGIIQRILMYTVGWQDDYFRLSEESQVPMFWSGNLDRPIELHSMLGASILGMTFGAIHFIAWNSEFPSHVELLLWRISCVAITAFPLTVTIFCGLWEIYHKVKKGWLRKIGMLLAVPLLPTALLYFVARVATLVMAFTTLRALPSDAFKTVDWATFIPHL